MFIEADKEDTVKNCAIRELYEKLQKKGKDNQYATIYGEDSNHTLVAMDPELEVGIECIA